MYISFANVSFKLLNGFLKHFGVLYRNIPALVGVSACVILE